MRKILLLIVAVALVCGAYFTVKPYFDTNVYGDSEEFKAFADKAIKNREICKTEGRTETAYDYDEILSYAVRYNPLDREEIRAFRDSKIQHAKDRFKLEAVQADRERYEKSDENTHYKPLKHACIIESSVVESGNGAITVLIYSRAYIEQDKDMVLESSDVDTFLLSEETYQEIEPIQAMNVNYKAKAAKYAGIYFEKAFNKKKLEEGWLNYLTDNDSNYNKFIMTSNEIIFCFDEGTVADKSEGIVTFKVPYQYMESAIRPIVLDRYIDPTKPMVAITYDDGPGGEAEMRILKCLEENGSVATFFYQGSMIQYNSENLIKATEIGCEIGNHSWDHPQFSLLSKSDIRSQIDRTNEAIKNVTGNSPNLIRPPFGDYNSKVNSVFAEEELTSIIWTIDTLDWKTRSPKMIVKSVKRKKKLDGKVILMHSIYDETAKASEKLIPWLKEHGYQTVTVSELIKYKTGETPVPGKVYWPFY